VLISHGQALPVPPSAHDSRSTDGVAGASLGHRSKVRLWRSMTCHCRW
jgi:hypothetical protein